MKHIKDAQKLVEQGDGKGALEILDNVLALAPNNIEALKLKAQILDAWGRFDEAFAIIQKLAQMRRRAPYSENEAFDFLDRYLVEERNTFFFSELTEEGRSYALISPQQLFVALFGFAGCIIFMILNMQWMQNPAQYFREILGTFVGLVLLPWVALSIINFFSTKKITLNFTGIFIEKTLGKKFIKWHDILCAVIEYDTNPQRDYLHLYFIDKNKKIAAHFDISKKRCAIRARRHFVKSVLSYLDIVIYRPVSSQHPLTADIHEFFAQQPQAHPESQLPTLDANPPLSLETPQQTSSDTQADQNKAA